MLFNSGSSGNGYITVTIHEAMIQTSTGLHHATCVYELIRYDAVAAAVNEELDFEEKNDEYRNNYVNDFMPYPYVVFIECDSGPDQNLICFIQPSCSFPLIFDRVHG